MTRCSLLIAAMTFIAITVARSGHELPVYPSYYPHEIEIATVVPERAADLLRDGKMHAYVGGTPRFAGAMPETITAVESFGSFVIVRVNPASPLAKDEASICALTRAAIREIGGKASELITHPYPVTPFHGDFLNHVDLAAAAKARLLGSLTEATGAIVGELKVRAVGALARSLVRAEWQAGDSDWDVAIDEVNAAYLVASAREALNGWLGPRWVRTGWFAAYRLLGDAIVDPELLRRIESDVERLRTGDYDGAVERINLERGLVGMLVGSCHKTVTGYTVKREYFNSEFSAGIENIAYDAYDGFNSPMFIRTVKLKDFPWNGWLALGVDGRPQAAWNPIAGLTDPFGRLTWFALGDPAAVPSPYDENWVFNRIADVESKPRR
jgi:hypothetical protein